MKILSTMIVLTLAVTVFIATVGLNLLVWIFGPLVELLAKLWIIV